MNKRKAKMHFRCLIAELRKSKLYKTFSKINNIGV